VVSPVARPGSAITIETPDTATNDTVNLLRIGSRSPTPPTWTGERFVRFTTVAPAPGSG
jgi:hypothetical protein